MLSYRFILIPDNLGNVRRRFTISISNRKHEDKERIFDNRKCGFGDAAFLEDGSYDLDRMGSHTHSVTCVMSSLAQLAVLTADAGLLNRVKLFFDNGLKDISDAIGWSIESAYPDAKSRQRRIE
jgi:hypothetical protein